MSFERAREFSQTRKADIERDVSDPSGLRSFRQPSGSFQTRAPDETIYRFACHALKNSMEMKGREMADVGEFFQRKITVQMLRDIIKHAVDPFFIVVFIHELPASFERGLDPVTTSA